LIQERQFGEVTEEEERRKEDILPFGRTCGREVFDEAARDLEAFTQLASVSIRGIFSEHSVPSCLVTETSGFVSQEAPQLRFRSRFPDFHIQVLSRARCAQGVETHRTDSILRGSLRKESVKVRGGGGGRWTFSRWIGNSGPLNPTQHP